MTVPKSQDVNVQGDSGIVNGDMMVRIVRDLAIPTYLINRTSVMPFDQMRNENDAEHSFSLGLVAICVAPLVDPELNIGMVAKYALIHDLPEIYSGDVSVYADEKERANKARREDQALERLRKGFSGVFPQLIESLDAYRRLDDKESRFVYALDKLLPHTMVLLGEYHPVKPTWREYKITEVRAREKIKSAFPELISIFDDLCAEFAKRPHLFSDYQPGEED